jgi:hypothetical protein
MYEYNDSYARNKTYSVGWWESGEDSELPKEEVEKARANSLVSTARNLEDIQREVHEQNLFSAQLYSNRELAAFDWGNSAMYRTSLSPVSRTGENLVLMVVDTLVSQIGKNRPKARPQTRGASWTLRQQAKRLDKFLYGEFIRNRVYEKGKQVFRDACIFGFGAMYVAMDGDDLVLERVFPDELMVDQMEVVATGKARYWYRRRVLPCEVVAATYKKKLEDIEAEAKKVDYDLDYRSVGTGHGVLVEGWQCALGSKVGRYVVAWGDVILVDRPYKMEGPPFAIYQWQPPLSGFYTASAVEQALPYQLRLNEINDVIRDAQDLMGRPRILVAEGSRVNPLEIDNLVARFIKYTGIKPEAVTWPAISAELYNERDRQVRICLEQFGISALASKVTPPSQARFDSSPAFREFNAIQDDRLADPAQRFERFYLDVAELMIRVIKDSGKSPQTTWVSGGKNSRIEVISWDEIDLDEDAYVLQLEATSVFDSTPSAIRDELEKQLGMGLITPEEYRLQLAHPDDESELSLQSAAADDIRRVIELLENGEYEPPTPIQDLVNGVQMVSLAALHMKKYDDVEPKVHLNFLNWVTAARAILEIGEEKVPTMDPSAMVPGLDAPSDPLGVMGGVPGMDPMMGGAPGMGGPMMPGAMGPGPAAVPVPESAGLGGFV